MRRPTAVAVCLVLLVVLVVAGCGGESRYIPTKPDVPSPPDTIIIDPPDTTIINPPDTIYVGGCGVITIEPFYVTRSQPLKYLRSFYFSSSVQARFFVRVANYRNGGGHTNQDLQLYAIRDGSGERVVFHRVNDDCGVLADTLLDGAATRWVGDANLSAGTWVFYALHGSQVECFTPIGQGNGPIDVLDGQIEFCPR